MLIKAECTTCTASQTQLSKQQYNKSKPSLTDAELLMNLTTLLAAEAGTVTVATV